MASWSNNQNTPSNLGMKFVVVFVVIVGCIIGISILAQNATSSGPSGSNDLEWRVSHLEGDMRGAYANTSYLTEHIKVLQRRVDSLEEYRDNIMGGLLQVQENLKQTDDGVTAVIMCIRNRKGYAIQAGHSRRDFMSHSMMAQCIDDWFDSRKGDH